MNLHTDIFLLKQLKIRIPISHTSFSNKPFSENFFDAEGRWYLKPNPVVFHFSWSKTVVDTQSKSLRWEEAIYY